MEQNLNQETGEIEIDLLELLKALWRHAWIIILAVVIGGGGAFSAAYFGITPTYKASAMMYVNNSMSSSISSTISSITSSDLTASKSLVDTYIVILGTRNVLEDVIEQSGVDYTYEELTEMIEAEAVNSTEIFEVTVTSTDPEEATLIANAIATILPDKIDDIVNGSSAKIVDWAVVPAQKAAPRRPPRPPPRRKRLRKPPRRLRRLTRRRKRSSPPWPRSRAKPRSRTPRKRRARRTPPKQPLPTTTPPPCL